jgi:hypothetical protein
VFLDAQVHEVEHDQPPDSWRGYDSAHEFDDLQAEEIRCQSGGHVQVLPTPAVVLLTPVEQPLEREIRLRIVRTGHGPHLVTHEARRLAWHHRRPDEYFDGGRRARAPAEFLHEAHAVQLVDQGRLRRVDATGNEVRPANRLCDIVVRLERIRVRGHLCSWRCAYACGDGANPRCTDIGRREQRRQVGVGQGDWQGVDVSHGADARRRKRQRERRPHTANPTTVTVAWLSLACASRESSLTSWKQFAWAQHGPISAPSTRRSRLREDCGRQGGGGLPPDPAPKDIRDGLFDSWSV